MIGAAGKTTLVSRLKEKTFVPELPVTVGVIMSEVVIDDIKFNILDFAGQKEYQHTHTLFFDNRAIILALSREREQSHKELEDFLQMIADCAPNAPIILIHTHADEGTKMSDLYIKDLRNRYKMIQESIAVDSKSGTGTKELEQKLVEIALAQPHTVKKDLPYSFIKLQTFLDDFANQGDFSRSHQEVKTLAIKYCNIEKSSVRLALDLLKDWGRIYILSNGHVVVKPQMLADVMACLFTTLKTTYSQIVDCSKGLIKHLDNVMEAIWGHFEPALWTLTFDEEKKIRELSSPFLDLLHDSNLAYRLYGPSGEPLNASLVPALLPDIPLHSQFEISSDAENESKLCSALLGQELNAASVFTLYFKSSIPITFLSRLQVKLSQYVELGLSWKKGFVISVSLRDKTQSKAIIFERTTDKSIIIICRDMTTPARLVALKNILKLQEEHYSTLNIKSYELFAFGVTWGENDLEDNCVTPGYFEEGKDRKSKTRKSFSKRVYIRDLSCLFGMEYPPIDNSARDAYVSETILAQRAPSVRIKVDLSVISKTSVQDQNIIRLKNITANMSKVIENCDDEESSRLYLELGMQLQNSIKILNAIYFKFGKKDLVKTIWPVLERKEGTEIIRAAIPMTPGVTEYEPWLFLVEHAVMLDNHRNLCNEDMKADPMILEAVDVFLTAIDDILETEMPDGWTVNRNCFFSDLSTKKKKIMSKQQQYFGRVGDRFLWDKFVEKARGMTLGTVLNNQIVQNNALIPLFQENKATLTKMDQKLDKVVAVTEKMLGNLLEFAAQIRKDLQNNIENMKDLRSIWRDSIDKIEGEIVKGGKDVISAVNKELRTFEALNKSFLEESQLDRGLMNVQFNEIKEKLNEALKQQNDKIGGENDVKLILTELRTLQAQMTQVLKVTTELQSQLDEGFEVIKKTIVNVNQRTFPSVFIIIDTSLEESNNSNSNESAMEKSSRFAKSFVKNMTNLYSMVTKPKEALIKALRDENHAIALICEICREPQPKVYPISEPKEWVGRLIPLASIGMKFLRVTNFIGGIGQIFGFPTPHVDPATLVDFEKFVDKVSQDSLNDYKELQERAGSNYPNKNEIDDNKVSMGDLGFCAREFRRFLKDEDPDDEWSGLSPYVTETGEVFFACRDCATKTN